MILLGKRPGTAAPDFMLTTHDTERYPMEKVIAPVNMIGIAGRPNWYEMSQEQWTVVRDAVRGATSIEVE